MDNRWVGVILAGGCGSRMGELGNELPKSVLLVGDRPVIGHQLKLLADLGAREIFLIVGYLEEHVVASARNWCPEGVEINIQRQEKQLGIAHALNQLRHRITSPFIVLLGDYSFMAPSAMRLVHRIQNGQSAISVKAESNPSVLRAACAVQIDPSNNRVVGIVEKPMNPITNLKGCGFYGFQVDFLDVLGRTPRTALRDEYELTVALEMYVKDGGSLYSENVFEWDVNLTSPKDLLLANHLWLTTTNGGNSFIDPTAVVAPSIALHGTVIGAGSVVEGRGTLTDTLVLPGTKFECMADFANVIVTPNGVYKG